MYITAFNLNYFLEFSLTLFIKYRIQVKCIHNPKLKDPHQRDKLASDGNYLHKISKQRTSDRYILASSQH